MLPSPATTVVSADDSGTRSIPRSLDDAPADRALAADEAYEAYGVREPMTLVYERMLDNGQRVRLQRGLSWEADLGYESGWQPRLFCWPTTESRLTIDGDDVVDVAGNGWFEELYQGLAVQAVEVGQADGHPLRVLQVQAAPGATDVAVTWPDGATDRTAIVDGAAVLVVDGINPYTAYTLEITDADGTRSMTSDDLDYYSDADYRAGCVEPPPPLPDPGQQPADRAAAEAELLERFAILWDRSLPEADKPDDLLDDRTGVDEAIAQVFEGGLAESAESAEHFVDEVVFTSPTEAWFMYGIDTINGYFGQRYGTATLTDGVWVFPRALVCQDLGLAGGGCEPWVEQIYPPSWYERYGDPYSECWIDEDGTEVCESFAYEEGYVDGPAPVPNTTILLGD